MNLLIKLVSKYKMQQGNVQLMRLNQEKELVLFKLTLDYAITNPSSQ